ncbi:hypothetical protein CHLRE_02g141926v5 [Chlamydomonas reinhardtii]|uniref:Protein kinase domain-containing protein n=1 Tax=Chlamydomonas reinhardtii TaxID=3055 RepID=A0A2K3E4B7_CHLRE|nr:uncharacterized protein CHLRE_02g141926v5 [Chlamydomonas reinhardtii]PNW87629.1 hypothetical protein CHLRE_02g141926v5 [Chlamydomonas reinhardtii]
MTGAAEAPTPGPGAGAVGAPPLPGPSPARKPAGSGGSIRPAWQQGLHAAPYTELSPSEVSECAPHEILNGIGLSFQQLGRGSFGVVVAGTYNGLACAVKIMLTNQLNKPALRELLLSPAINHASLVQTFTSRCARLSNGFFDLLEDVAVPGAAGTTGTASAARSNSKPHRSRPRRALQPIPLLSGDGFGDPGCGVVAGDDPYRVLHAVLHDFIAETNQFMIVIVQMHTHGSSLTHKHTHELCDGTLHAAIRAGAFRPIPTNPHWNLRLARRALLRTALEMARGLLHLHDTGLVHGDLKPHNVLLAKSHDDRRGFKAKVADFGLSHVLPQRANSVSTDSFGSPAYMAPEAFTGRASKATDGYSFGVCLWELLCGRTPYSDVQGGAVCRMRPSSMAPASCLLMERRRDSLARAQCCRRAGGGPCAGAGVAGRRGDDGRHHSAGPALHEPTPRGPTRPQRSIRGDH